ncbi:MAG: hypothetical protein JSS02_22490 [Planctomycetes bacterium]|nr:hypothetical protein [Planctomycetota bacterium]
MSNPVYIPLLHRLAVATVCLALLPILMGALTTTKDAGMAFRDWPSSDGHNMLTYPWLQSTGDKFLEHGHRLAGVLIGMTSIALAVTATLLDQRRWLKCLAWGVLLSVIGQGLLGGSRVLLDQRGLAFVHGSFAALVMGLMILVAVATSPGWYSAIAFFPTDRFKKLHTHALFTCLSVFAQYVLGGLLRHRGMVLYEHLAFAFFAALMVLWLALTAIISGAPWLVKPGKTLVLLMVLQLALGAGAWVVRFGFGDYVAVYGSPIQVVVRTGHVLGGMLLFATTILLTVRISRLHWMSARCAASNLSLATLGASVPVTGGAR